MKGNVRNRSSLYAAVLNAANIERLPCVVSNKEFRLDEVGEFEICT